MEAPMAHTRLSSEVWKEIFAHLPMMWRPMCCRVCRVWQEDLEQPHQGQGDDMLVDYGLGTLCSALATKGVDEVMRRIRLHYPTGISANLGRTDQVRRFVLRHCYARIVSVDEWMQLASQEPDAGWLCKAVSKTKLEGMGKGLMRQVVGKPQGFSQLLDSLAGHLDFVYSVAWSPDGEMIASASKDRSVRLWTKAGELKSHLTHSGHVYSVAWSPDGEVVASCGSDDIVRLWSRSGEHKGTLRGSLGVATSVAYSPDGCTIASGCLDNTVRLLDAKAMREKCGPTRHSCSVRSVAWSPDGEMIASGSRDKTVCLWSKSGEHMGTLRGHSGSVRSVAWSPDGEMIASGSRDRTVCLWSKSGERKRKLTGHRGSVHSVAWSPDGEMIASGSRDKLIGLWSKSGELKGTLRGYDASWPHLDPETKALASKVHRGWPAGSDRTGQYPVRANGSMVYVYRTDADGGEQREPLACFLSPARVTSVSCRGTSLAVGCEDGQVSGYLLCGANAAVY